MSEVQKPIEEPVVAPTTEAPVAAEPVAEIKPVEETPAVAEPATETPAVAEPVPAATEEAASPVKEEPKPIEEGVLGYKAPGLIKSFIFQKKHFWFGTEPVESKHLSSYLRGEKSIDAANHNVAWASHTGKGLLFFSKKSTEKASPAGLVNLSEASEITTEGPTEFFFTILSHKHTFQAANLTERDSWVSTLKTKIAEAKESKDSVTGTDAYKNTHSSLTKPALAAAAVGIPKKSTEAKEEKKEVKEEKAEEKKEAKEEKKEEKAEEKKARTSRSASRKRNSIFGSIAGFGKKEEKVEPKEETPVAVAPEETPAAVEPVEPVAAPAEPVVPAAPVAPVEETPVVTDLAPAEETKPAEPKPAPSKRNSIFGTLSSKFSAKDKKPEEAAPAVPAKDAEPVSETAPVIPAVEATEPLAASVASPATVPTETTEIPATNGEAKTETPAVKSDKRKSSLPWLSKKEKPITTEEETEKVEKAEKPKSPFAKLRATVKGKTSPKAPVTSEKPAEEVAEPVKEAEIPAISEAAPVTAEPVVSEPISAAPVSTPQVSATA